MADDNLRISASMDVGPIVSGTNAAGAAVQSLADKFKQVAADAQRAGDAVLAQAARFQAQGLTAEQAAQALMHFGSSATEAATAAAAAASAAGVEAAALTTVAEAATGAGVSMQASAMAGAKVREELGALTGSIGGIEYGLARVASRIPSLIPIISDVFPLFLAIGFVEMLGAMISKIGEVVSAYEGWDAVTQRLYADALKANAEEMKYTTDLKIQQMELNEIGLKGSELEAVSAKDAHAAALLKTADAAAELAVQRDLLAQRDKTAAQSMREQGVPETAIRPWMEQQALVREGSKEWDDLTKRAAEAGEKARDYAKEGQNLELVKLPTDKLKETADLAKEVAEQEKKLREIWDQTGKDAVKAYDLQIAATKNRTKAEEEMGLAVSSSSDREVRAASEAAVEKVKFENDYLAALRSGEEQAALISIGAQEIAAKQHAEMQKEKLRVSLESAPHKSKDLGKLQTDELETQKRLEQEKADAVVKSLEAQRDAMGSHAAELGSISGIGVGTAPRAVPENAADAALLAKWQELQNKIVDAKKQAAAKMQEIDGQIKLSNQQTANQIQQYWASTMMRFMQPFETAFDGVIKGTESVKFAFIKLGGELVMNMVHSLEQMLMKWITTHVAMTIVHALMGQQQVIQDTTTAAEKQAIQAASATATITQYAGVAAAEAYAAEAAVPVVGPGLAAGAAATAFSEVMAFNAFAAAQKGAIVPRNMPLNVHEGEMVLPAGISRPLQQALSPGGGGIGANPTNVHIHAMDSESMRSFLYRNQRTFVSLARGAIRNGRF
jgi:hypothetical protein